MRCTSAAAAALLLAFDVLVLDGQNLRPLAWQDRHVRLEQLGLGTRVAPGAPRLGAP